MARYCDGNHKVCGDTTYCETCGRRWDTNENLFNYPPNCPVDEEFADMKASERRWKYLSWAAILISGAAVILATWAILR